MGYRLVQGYVCETTLFAATYLVTLLMLNMYDKSMYMNMYDKSIYMQAASNWLYIYPKGFRDLLLYIKTMYNNPLIYITENGKSTYYYIK